MTKHERSEPEMPETLHPPEPEEGFAPPVQETQTLAFSPDQLSQIAAIVGMVLEQKLDQRLGRPQEGVNRAPILEPRVEVSPGLPPKAVKSQICGCPECKPYRLNHWVCAICHHRGDFRDRTRPPYFTRNVLFSNGIGGYADYACCNACEVEYRKGANLSQQAEWNPETPDQGGTGAMPEVQYR